MPGIPKGTLALATVLLGSTQIQQVRFGTTQIWANEVVVVLANTSNVTLKNLFTSVQWANVNLKKRVVVPVGVEITATVNAYAILATIQADGLAGSWAGSLTLEVRGTVSGIGGTANSGVGGTVVNANFTGRNGEKLQINLIGGTFRAGGGGGGRAGNGGMGLYYTTGDSGWQWANSPLTTWNRVGGDAGHIALAWFGTMIVDGATPGSLTVYSAGGYTYYKGAVVGDNGFTQYNQIKRTWSIPNYTSGGVSGNAGRGQGCDGAATVGAAAVAGGTNAGASGKSGDGAPYGGTGQTGANGSTGNYTGGTAGAAGGLPGFYLTGAANSNFTNTGGTVLGRLAS